VDKHAIAHFQIEATKNRPEADYYRQSINETWLKNASRVKGIILRHRFNIVRRLFKLVVY